MKPNHTARLTNSITSTAFKSFNKWGGVTYEDILSNYPTSLIEKAWEMLSTFIIENYQMGKGTFIKGLGTFTFTNIEYSLEGTTNQYERDVKKRRPLFLLSGEFVDTLKPGQYTDKSGIIYYTQKANNNISIVKVNYASISYGLNISKEEAFTILSTIIKDMGDKIRRGVFSGKTMPGLGTFLIRGNVFGMKFENTIQEKTMLIPQKWIHIKKNIGLFMETSKSPVRQRDILNIDKAIREVRPEQACITKIDPTAEQWLKNNMDVYIKEIGEETREDEFINLPRVNKDYLVDQRFFRAIPKQNIKGWNISQEILEAIARNSHLLLREFKSLDKHENGMITTFDFENGFRNTNVHHRWTIETIKKLTHLYLQGFNGNNVNYTLLLKAIVNDINAELHTEYTLFPIDKYRETNADINKRAVSAYAFNRSTGISANQSISALENYGNINPISPNEVKDDMTKIKKIAKYLSNTETKANRTISYLQLMTILQNYSIQISKFQMIKILKYMNISNPNAFNYSKFLHDISKTTFTKPIIKVTQQQINSAIAQITKTLGNIGGIDYLFQNEEFLTYDNFIDRISPHTNITSNVLRAVFDYISNNQNSFDKNVYMNHFLSSNEERSLSNNFEIKAMKTIWDRIYFLGLRSDTYFDHLLSYNICRVENVISPDEFERLMQWEEFKFTISEIHQIFRYFDFYHDNILNRVEWNKTLIKIPHPITTVQNFIRNHRYNIEDLAYKMSIDLYSKNVNGVWKEKIDRQKFKLKMKQVNEAFPNEFIFSLFHSISGSNDLNGTVTALDIFKHFNIYKDTNYSSINGKEIHDVVTQVFQSVTSFGTIISKFQEIDKFIKKVLPLQSFLKVIHETLNNRIKDEQIIRFARMNRLIDFKDNVFYHDLMNVIYYDCKPDSFSQCIRHLTKYLRQDCNNDWFLFFVKMNNMDNGYGMKKYVSFEKWFEFFRNHVDMLEVKTLHKLDVDGDGIVSFDDWKAIIIKYIDNHFFDNKNQIDRDTAEKEWKLTLEGFNKIVTAIRVAIKKINYTEIKWFQVWDHNQDSFIDKEEFTFMINQLPMKTKLTPAQVSSFYSYWDEFNNNKVNIETFLRKFRKFNSDNTLYKGNFIIEELIISEFSKWFLRNTKLCDTEVFSILDKDHDGLISCDDLKNFALDTLRLSKNEMNDSKVNHVINAISLTKTNNLCWGDIRNFMERIKMNDWDEYYQTIKEMCNVGIDKTNKDKNWLKEVIDIIGMFINEKYGNCDKFYNDIVNKITNKVKKDDFKLFLNRNYTMLSGFKVEEKEINVIFNHITNNQALMTVDHLNKIFNGKYDFYKKMHDDIYIFLNENFINNIDAFKYFHKVNSRSTAYAGTIPSMSKTDFITTVEFFKGLNYLFPKKYATDTLRTYISNVFPKTNENPKITFSEFSYVYFNTMEENKIFNKTFNFPSTIYTSRPYQINPLVTFNSPFIVKEHHKWQTPYDNDPLEKIKRLILSSKPDFKTLFQSFIYNSSNGMANQFEFRNMIKKLDWGLTNIEIEDIINHAGKTRENNINLVDFYKYITNEDSNLAVSKEHILAQIKEIKQLIYKYYTNPKLAFQWNDMELALEMDFEKFKRIIHDIYTRDSKPSPSYGVLKCVYDFLDVRKDGSVSINEWNKVFAISEGILDINADKGQLQLLRDWETSNDISSIYRMIARNKKQIKDKVKLFSVGHGSVGWIIQCDNLISILRDVLGKIRLSHTQWKMLVAIGDRDKSGMIDFDTFIKVVETTAKMETSHPNLRKFK